MKPGNKVKWTDPLSGMVKRGVLLEKVHIISLAVEDQEGNVGEFKDVDKWSWDIRRDNGERYSFPEDELTPELPN